MADRVIKVIGGTTTNYVEKIVPSSTLLSDFAKDNSMITAGSTLQLDGRNVTQGELNKSFGELIPASKDECRFFSVVNAKNA